MSRWGDADTGRAPSPFMTVELAISDDDDELRKERVVTFAHHLQAADVDVEIRDNELAMLWGKLIFLAPLALLTTKYGTSAGDIRTTHRNTLLAVIDEIAHIGEKLGAGLSANAALQFFDSVPETMQSSMQHDAASGRTIEIEAIGGAILRAAALSGIPAPVTEMLVNELRQIEPQQPSLGCHE